MEKQQASSSSRHHVLTAAQLRPPSFCKVVSGSMEGSYSNCWMQIPSAFVKLYLQRYVPKSPETIAAHKPVTLEGPSGKTWPVSILGWKTSSLGFKTGWRKFANDHSLVVGDVIIFKMTSINQFVVQIFGKGGMEKSVPLENVVATNQCGKRKNNEAAGLLSLDMKSKKMRLGHPVLTKRSKEMTEKAQALNKQIMTVSSEADVDQEHDTNMDQSLLEAFLELRSQEVPAIKPEVDTDNFVVLEEEQRAPARALFPMECTLDSVMNQPCKLQNLREIAKRMPVQKFPALSVSQDVTEKSHNETNFTNFEEDFSESEVIRQRSSTLVSRRRPITQAEQEGAINAAQAFKTQRPAFCKIMKTSHVYRGFWLGIPRDFKEKHLTSERKPARLIDSSGKEWRAKLLGNRDNPGLSGGWRKFAVDHGLEEGDVCIFEVLDRTRVVIKVHIFRAIELGDTSSNKQLLPKMKTPRQVMSPKKKMKARVMDIGLMNASKGKQLLSEKEKVDDGPTKNAHQPHHTQSASKKMRGAMAPSTAMLPPESCDVPNEQPKRFMLVTALPATLNATSMFKSKIQVEQRGKARWRHELTHITTSNIITPKIQGEYPKTTDIALVKVKQEIDSLDERQEDTHTLSPNLHSSASDIPTKSMQVNCSNQETSQGLQSKHSLNENFSAWNKAAVKSEENCGLQALSQDISLTPPVNVSSQCHKKPSMSLVVQAKISNNRCLSKCTPSSSRTKKGRKDEIESNKTVPSGKEHNCSNDNTKPYYLVDRLISRRKGNREDEFLVQLSEQANEVVMTECEKEDGEWWVPLSHFKDGFQSCHL